MMTTTSNVQFLGNNFVDLHNTMASHFGPGDDGSWSVVKVGTAIARIEHGAGDTYLTAYDTLWIKGTSILVDKA
jgi:hypothetical protein